jgi:putative Ca2+/H+ antiporter (TMEM165/GDT1 family)
VNLKVFFLAYSTLFLAELGDKTQLAVFTLAAQYKCPWVVFGGASLGLLTVTLISALLGQTIVKLVPPEYLQLVAGVLFVVLGIGILWGAARDLLG